MSTIQGNDLIAMLTGGALELRDPSTPPDAPILSGTATELDTEVLADVLEVLNEYGKEAVFTAYPGAAYDPTTGDGAPGTAWQYSHRIIPPDAVALQYVNGDTIRVGDMITGVAASGIEFTPTNAVKVTIDSVMWSIVHVAPVYSGQRIALYVLQLRN